MDAKLHINQLIRALGLLKSSKLEYLKTAEDGILPKYNVSSPTSPFTPSLFSGIGSAIAQFPPGCGYSYIKESKMEQRLVASLEDSQKTSFENCLDIDVQIIGLLERIETTKIQLDSLIQSLKCSTNAYPF